MRSPKHTQASGRGSLNIIFLSSSNVGPKDHITYNLTCHIILHGRWGLIVMGRKQVPEEIL